MAIHSAAIMRLWFHENRCSPLSLFLLPTDFIALCLSVLFPFSAIKAANDKNVNHAVRIPLSNAMIRQSDMTFVVVYAKCGVEKKAMRQLPNAPN